MVICESYMFEFSVDKDLKKKIKRRRRRRRRNEGGGSRKGSNTFMSNTNCQGIENYC